jgi:predicted deacylase
VSVDESKMRALLQWLDPAKSPRIIMGPKSAITRSGTAALADSTSMSRAAVAPMSSTTTTRIGTSREGRAIVAVRRGPARASRTLVIIGSIHGNERYGHRVVSLLRTSTLPSGLAVVLIPTMNPDGVDAVERTNARGVDLNRNFPTSWVSRGGGTSRWSGPSAGSEPETRAVRDYLDRLNPSMVVIFHSALDGVDLYGAKSAATVRALARATGFRAASFDCNGGCHGTLTQWFNRTQAGQAITFEFGESPSSAVISAVARGVVRVAAEL